jgi:N-acetyl-anhydromuramyl-L-alanine amidase AmpD
LQRVSLREQLLPYTNNADDLFSPPKADRPWKYVVLHHSASPAGNYDAIDLEHRKRLGWEGCGYHFVIGNGTGSPDGQIEVAQRWTNQKHGIHCRNGKNPDVSEYGIGICLVGDLDNQPPTARQIAATKALVAYLGQRYKIPADHIDTHAHLASNPTTCPGKYFPTQEILGSNSHFVQR